MDIALHYWDEYVGDALYASLPPTPALLSSVLPSLPTLARDNVLRQILSLYALVYVGIFVLYFSVATASYYLIFDHRMKSHPRFLPNQVRKEIIFSLQAFPLLDLLTLPWFLGDVRGYSMLYDSIEEGPFGTWGWWQPWVYMAAASLVFLVFTDYCIYWIHRWLHLPFFYKRLHKPHHRWIIPTPFASHAFHPVDGYLQSVPYHLICYLVPLHKYLFVALFSFVNLWSIFIHDSDMISNTRWENYINGPAHHFAHHLFFNCNYGQYFVWADKAGGSFRAPSTCDDPILVVLAARDAKLKLEQLEREREKLEESEREVMLRSGSTTPMSLSGSSSGGSSSSGSDEDDDAGRIVTVSERERKEQ